MKKGEIVSGMITGKRKTGMKTGDSQRRVVTDPRLCGGARFQKVGCVNELPLLHFHT